MTYFIQLARYAVQNVDWRTFGTYRMRVEVTAVEGDGLDPYLFLYQRFPQSPYFNEPCDHFVGLAGPAQIADLPVGEPSVQQFWPFFRQSWVELDFTSEAQAMEVWTIINAEAAALCEGMSRYKVLAKAEEVWVPFQPAYEPGSSSSSQQG